MTVIASVFTIHSILQNVVPQPWQLLSNQQLAATRRSYSTDIFKALRIFSPIQSFCLTIPFVLVIFQLEIVHSSPCPPSSCIRRCLMCSCNLSDYLSFALQLQHRDYLHCQSIMSTSLTLQKRI